ncbi:MAG: D-alanine--D-alanine ligase [Ruminococcus sp.]|nr:D-alanine--D-alanine ligase [Ruminococcus sp.]
MAKIRVAVLFGGVSSEHDVSLISATNVINSIPKDKYEVVCVGITRKGRWLYFPGDVNEIASGAWERNPDCAAAIISPDPIHKGIITIENGETYIKKIDVVFPVLHGRNGEDGRLQGLLEMAKLPFVGCGTLSSAICMDKSMTHTVLDYNGIRTARWTAIYQRDISRMDEKCAEAGKKLGFPLFVKPANAGSSVGVNKANNLEELKDAVQIAFSHDCKVIVEEFIKGKELEVAVFGQDTPFASYVGEIEPAADFYDYDDKYINGSSKLYIPARITDQQSDEIRKIAIRAYQALCCKGLSRVDFFLTEEGTIYLNEINTLPGFTSISMYPKLMENLGMEQSYLVDKLIEQAMDNTERVR